MSGKDPAPAQAKQSDLVRIVDVTKFYGDFCVLDKVSLSVSEGETVVVMGPSGSGKSTLLRTVNRLESIGSGSIWVDGVQVAEGGKEHNERLIAEGRRNVGMVFQQFNLFSHMTALENVAAGPRFALGQRREQAITKAGELLESVGLSGREYHYPGQLSGGQQQRVAIARALAMEPRLLLFDEPTSSLDPEMVSEVVDVMENLSKQGTTMIVVTHETSFARRAASRVVFMENGRLIEDTTPDKFFNNPVNDRTKAFLGRLLQ